MNIDDIATGFAKINQMRDRIAALEAENERLRRQVEFVKNTTRFYKGACICGFAIESGFHHRDCPNNEANQ